MAHADVFRTMSRRVPKPDLTQRQVINPGAVPFPAWWESRPRSAFMAAMATSVSQIGFAATRVEDVVELARASRRTFYKHFDKGEDCLFAVHAAILDDALVAIDSAESEEAALKGLMIYLAAWPAHAHVLLVAMPAAGPEGLRRHEAAQDELAERIARCFGRTSSGAPGLSDDQLLQARFGAAQRLVQREVIAGKHRALPRLVPALSAVMSSVPTA
ncbi:MAG TPA: TetR family transcriptional regulator [Baekduia sp.]